MVKNAQIYIDVSGFYTRVALMENGELTEFSVESESDSNKLVGNIYRGKVVNVLQGMQAAFVDIGRARNAFLFVSDMPIDRRDIAGEIKLPDQLSVNVGQEIICQVIKDEVGTKGARVTTNVSIAGRYVVTTPTLSFHGISRKIEDVKARERLLGILQGLSSDGSGGIARTASLGATKKEIAAEMRGHLKLYREIKKSFETASVGDILYSDGDIVYRTARDIVTERVESITTNSPEIAQRLARYMEHVGMTFGIKINLYDGAADMFGDFLITPKINALLSNRVALKSGGSLVIDKTEALTAIDVNSGKFVGNAYLEDTVFQVNAEACEEIARQLRLRNLGGIIIVDFIDMEMEEHRAAILEKLETCLKADRIKTRIAGMTSLGLVQITRKKTNNDISASLQEPCPHCGGVGRVTAAAVMVPRVSQSIHKCFRDPLVQLVLVTVENAIAQKLLSGALTHECETVWADKRIYVLADDSLARDEIKTVGFKSKIVALPNDAKLMY